MLLLFLLFVIWPFGGFVISLILLSKSNLRVSTRKSIPIILSLFWGLLAYTQKSMTNDVEMETDVTRYYYTMSGFEYIPVGEVLSVFNFLELINYFFYPISAYVVSITRNVQSLSLFWVFISYFIFYYSIWRLTRYYHCCTHKTYFLIVFISTFCFMVFVQISELLKNASAFSVFFLALTLFIEKSWNKWSAILVFVAIGLHPSVFMLLPLFLYRYFKTKTLLIASICILPLSVSINIFELLWSILPGGNYINLLLERFGANFEESGSMHYLLKELLMLCLAVWIWIKTGKKDNDLCNIVFLYFIISSLNYINLVAYLRFSLLSHFLFAIMLMEYFRTVSIRYRLDRVALAIILCTFLLTTRYTIGRTTPGGYASSYMDNSLTKVVFSTSLDYLAEDYEK